MEDTPLTEQMKSYHGFMEKIVDEDGFSLPHGIVINPEGEVTMLALAVSPQESYQAVLLEIAKQSAVEAIWALDRYAQPDQGTTLRDLLAGQHYVADPDKKMVDCFRGFIIEYQYEPRIFKAPCYDNPFWTPALRSELVRSAGGMFIRTVRAHAPAG